MISESCGFTGCGLLSPFHVSNLLSAFHVLSHTALKVDSYFKEERRKAERG